MTSRDLPFDPVRRRVFVLGAGALAGCAMPPMSVPDPGVQALDRRDRLKASFDQGESVLGQVSLYEAMARALKYNLDARIERLDAALRQQQFEVKAAEQLPRVLASSGFSGRSNDAGTTSESLITGNASADRSISSERGVRTSDLRLSWDLLDYGLARVRAQQAAGEVLLAKERRRKVTNRIIEDVRTAYWRAVSADRTFRRLADLESLAQKSLSDAEELERRRIAPPLAVLAYQRDLLQTQAEAQRLQRELALAKSQLAALMNLPPGASFKLVLPDRSDLIPELPGAADDMVVTGLRFRPELREAMARRRITELEQQAALLRALPSVTGVLGLNHDSNRFLFHQQWADFSARVSWNLMNVFRYPTEKAALTAELAVQDQRDLALTLAVMTQVHVSRARFLRLSQELNTVRRSTEVQGRITELTRSGFKARSASQQSLVREEFSAVLAEVRYDNAYADLQNAYANLYASMGLDNFEIDIDADLPLATLTEQLEEHWTGRANELPPLPRREG
ncbi:MAG: hypothetical protein RLY78_1887 [Pseudomonadota bacterium]|jgi:outer membrane protein TolC